MKGRVLFVLHPKQGPATSLIRGTIYEATLRASQWEVSYVSISFSVTNPELNVYLKSEAEIIQVAKAYDIVYLLKVNSYFLVKKLKAHTSAKIIFDLTDALWRPKFRKRWVFLEEIMQLSDAVFTENEYASEYARRFNSTIIQLAACTQIEKFDEVRAVKQRNRNENLVIGWIGSESTIGAVYSIAPQLRELSLKYPQVHLRILGAKDHGISERLKGINYSVLGDYTEKEMIEEALVMDIGIFPPPSDTRDYCIRGALKGMIYMSAGIPAVCLNAGDISKIVIDGDNGVLVNSADEWETKIEKLILDADLRQRIGRSGNAYIRRDHSLAKIGSDLSNAFQVILTTPPKKPQAFSVFRKLKVLIGSVLDN